MRRSTEWLDRVALELLQLMRRQVVIRYGMARKYGKLHYEADLVNIHGREGSEYLTHFTIVVHVADSVQVESVLNVTEMSTDPGVFATLLERWNSRRFDDWVHDSAYMGAIGVYSGGQPYTSIKIGADRGEWNALTGIIVSKLEGFGATQTGRDDQCAHGLEVMQKRFSAFAAQTLTSWAHRTLNLG